MGATGSLQERATTPSTATTGPTAWPAAPDSTFFTAATRLTSCRGRATTISWTAARGTTRRTAAPSSTYASRPNGCGARTRTHDPACVRDTHTSHTLPKRDGNFTAFGWSAFGGVPYTWPVAPGTCSPCETEFSHVPSPADRLGRRRLADPRSAARSRRPAQPPGADRPRRERRAQEHDPDPLVGRVALVPDG